MSSLVWLRRDVRLDDNPALVAATEHGPVCVLFVIDPALYESCSQRRRELLVSGLHDLDRRLQARGGRLRVERGNPAVVVPAVADELKVGEVHINEEVTPYGRRRDERVSRSCRLVPHDGIYVHPPGSVLTNEGRPYQVFTPFFRKWASRDVKPHRLPDGAEFADKSGRGMPELADGTGETGETAAEEHLAKFTDRIESYLDDRERIDRDATSRLSVDLKYGWLGPRRVLSEIGRGTEGRRAFLRQLAWRDFYGHVIATHQTLAEEPMDPRYRDIDWRNDLSEIDAWQGGQTGVPLIDAAMRQLVSEGYLHNRARMVAASFLVKDLLVDWRIGERFFRHHLIDGDIAQNAGNWQWVAGTGTDAAPYFRIFNPVTQSKRFDPQGRYIRRWVPELADVPDALIHAPWESGPLELLSYGVELGKDYPEPIIDHDMARVRAIEAYEAVSGSR